MKKVVSAMVLTLFLIGMLMLAFNVQPVKASGTIYIRADGSVDPPDAPISTVDNVTYTLTDNITSDADGIVVERSNIIIDGAGYTVEGTGSGKGFYLSGMTNVTIKNTNIRSFSYSISLFYSSNNSISGNNITNNEFGISLSGSNNSIAGNNITANNQAGIDLASSDNNSVGGNNIANNSNGISLSGSNNSIYGNNITNNGHGIRLEYHSNYNSISGNILTNNTVGIELRYSSNNSIYGNNVANNWIGIRLYVSSNNSMVGNHITNNYDGIYLGKSSNNTISENNITANNDDGIFLGWSSNNNSISGNNITANNQAGIRFYDGSSNTNNVIFHNNFIDNVNQVWYTYGYLTHWDDGYPSGGNYWSDYTGIDIKKGADQNQTGSDGIGDTPYNFDVNNTDRYPLMAPINIFDAGTWNEVNYYVDVVSNSTVSDFYFNPNEGPILKFNVTGMEGTAGFCRVTIPKGLLWTDSGWTINVNNETITSYEEFSDDNNTYIYFTYQHSTKTLTIKGTYVIPEFSLIMIPPLFIFATLIVIILSKKKRKPKP